MLFLHLFRLILSRVSLKTMWDIAATYHMKLPTSGILVTRAFPGFGTPSTSHVGEREGRANPVESDEKQP
jgi:hypothetical protein